ncbi:MAG: hypothetical protein HY319_07460 [Armatimonadetes bacterium]|nr:hypothetical protein [Armatimonadota bacterium]
MKNRRGIAIIVVLLCTALLSVVALAITTLGSTNLLHAHSETEGLNALYAARAGAWLKAAQIRNGDAADLAAPQSMGAGAEFTVKVYAEGETVPAADFVSRSVPFTVPSSEGVVWYVLATGRSANGTRRQLGLLLVETSGNYDFAVFANKKIEIKGGPGGMAYTDTWDSSVDEFRDSQAPLAKIGVNTEEEQSIVFGGIAERIGKTSTAPGGAADVFAGPAAPGTAVKGDKGGEFRSFQNLAQPRTLDPVDPPFPSEDTKVVKLERAATQSIEEGGYGDVTLEGGAVLKLNTATAKGDPAIFVFKSLTMLGAPGSAPEIQIDHQGTGKGVLIYVEGDVKMEKGGLVNDLKDPSEFELQVTDGHSVLLEAEGRGIQAYYVCHAPGCDIKVAGGEVFGALVGNQVTIESKNGRDGAVHYDLQLKNGRTGTRNLSLISIQRL